MSRVAAPEHDDLEGETLPATVPEWLLHHSRTRPRATAYRVKELGCWREVSWSEHCARVAAVGRAFAHLGLGPGARVLVLCENRPEWLVSDLAAQGLGATTVAGFPSAPVAELHELVERTRPQLAIVEDEEQVDRLLEARDSSVERIFVADPRGIGRLEHPAASFEQLEALGSIEAVEFRADDVGFWERSVETLDLASIAAIAFTPGTTGTPKGVMLTQANLAAAAEAGVTAYGLRSGDRIVSCLPLAEITERVLVVAQATRAACTVHFGEGADALEQDVREVEPTVLLGAPRLWARFRDRIDDGLRDAGRLKRAAFRGAVAPRHRIGRVAGRLLVSGPLRRYAGLARVRVALVGGAPTPTDLVDWWARVGIGLRELYGLTESTGVGTVCGDADVATGSVGRPVPGVEIAIRDESTSTPGTGEVLMRGPVVCAAYLDDPEATRRFATDGWLHTGDVGALDDQQRLTIVDRVKDVIVLSAGHAVAPRPIERRLTSSPFMRTALVVGEGRSHLGALIDIDDQAVGDWAAERGAAYTTSETLRAVPEARELIGDVIEQLNLDLIEEERIQAFALLPDVLDVNGGMLTATAKVRREAITTRYAELVEAMYT